MIICDLETDGLPRAVGVDLNKQPRIIEFFGLKVDDETLEIKDELEFLVNPGGKLDKEIVEITGITDEMLKSQRPFAGHVTSLVDFFLGERNFVAHNVSFEKMLLGFEMDRLDLGHNFPWCRNDICTVEMSEHYEGRRMKLSDLHHFLLGEGFKDAHRAKPDVMATYRVIKAMKERGDWI